MHTRRSLVMLVAVAIVLVAAVATTTTQCGSRSSTARPPRSTPVPVSLALPTTIHYGDSTTSGARLTQPTSRAKVTVDQALAMNDLNWPTPRTATVLADVTMPGDFYQGKSIRGLTCWVVANTLPQAQSVSLGPPGTAPVIVQHSVAILDARTGAFVRGFYTK